MASNLITEDTVASLVDRLDWAGVDLSNERACIMALVGTGTSSVIVALGLDEALAELRRRRAAWSGAAAAQAPEGIAA